MIGVLVLSHREASAALRCPVTMDSVPATVPSVTSSSGDPVFEEPASREQGAREEPLEPGRHACHRLWPCWEVEARGLLTLHLHTCLRNFQSAAFLEHL